MTAASDELREGGRERGEGRGREGGGREGEKGKWIEV